MAIDVSSLWDFGDPEASETRFREAQTGASEVDRLILETQIARTYSLRKRFDEAQTILQAIPQGVHSEVDVRRLLELGRSLCGGAHDRDDVSDDDLMAAKAAYVRAAELAQDAELDGLAIDALHMMTFVETTSEAQIEWNHRALAAVDASNQPAAKKWEGSLRNNLGYALNQAGRFEEAGIQFEKALALREGQVPQERIARWMVAWNLRCLGQIDQALEMQLQLESEWDAAGQPSIYVYRELAELWETKGDLEAAAKYRALGN